MLSVSLFSNAALNIDISISVQIVESIVICSLDKPFGGTRSFLVSQAFISDPHSDLSIACDCVNKAFQLFEAPGFIWHHKDFSEFKCSEAKLRAIVYSIYENVIGEYLNVVDSVLFKFWVAFAYDFSINMVLLSVFNV